MTYTHFSWFAVVLCVLASGCGPESLPPETRLPRGYDDIMLGDTFDPVGTGAKEITSTDGIRRFRVERVENQPPVIIRLDDSGRVVGISWGQYVIDAGRRAAVMRQAKERFGQFLKEERETDSGKTMIFEDETTRYRLDFLNQEVRIAITDPAYDFGYGEAQ